MSGEEALRVADWEWQTRSTYIGRRQVYNTFCAAWPRTKQRHVYTHAHTGP